MERFFTTEQVANILQVHPFTILKFIKEGKLKGVKLGRVYRIKEGDVQEFLESRTVANGTSGSSKKHTTVDEADKAPGKKSKEDKESKEENQGDEGKDHYYII